MKTLFTTIFCLLLIFCSQLSNAQVADTILARQYLEQADSLSNARNRKEAINLFEKASQIFQESQLLELKAITDNKIGTQLRLMTDFPAAIEKYKSVTHLIESELSVSDSLLYNNKICLSRAYLFNKQPNLASREVDKVLQSIEQSEIFLSQEDEKITIYRAYNIKSEILGFKGELDKALDFALKALESAKEIYKNQPERQSLIHNTVASSYIGLEKFELALSYFNKALEFNLIRYPNEYDPAHSYEYLSMAICYVEMGEVEKAEDYFLKSHTIRLDTYGESHRQTGYSYWNLGRFYSETDQLEKAIDCYIKEIKIWNELDQQWNLSQAHLRLAYANLQFNKIEESLSQYHAALAIVSQNTPKENIYLTPRIEDIIISEKALECVRGKLSAINYALKQGYQDIELAKTAIDLTKLNLSLWNEISLKLGNQNKAKQYQIKHVKNNFEYGSLAAEHLYHLLDDFSFAEEAFLLAEQGKGILIQENFLQVNNTLSMPLSEDIKMEEVKLSNQLSYYENQLLSAFHAKDTNAINRIRSDSIFPLKIKYDQYKRKVEKLYPEYAFVQYEVPTIDLKSLQNKLKDNEILIEYVLQEESKEMIIFTITKHRGLQVVKQKYKTEVLANASKLKQLLQSFLLRRTDKKEQFIKLSCDFYNLLIAPIQVELEGKNKMIIIGEDMTYYIPFELLLSNRDGNNFDAMNFLIKDFEISYHYSALLYLKAQESKHFYEKDLLAFAPVFDNSNRQTALQRSPMTLDTTLRSVDNNGNFRPLLNSKAEVENIAQLFQNRKRDSKVTILLKDDANEGNLKHALRENYRFVHLASHSFSDVKTPELSGIACISIEEKKTEQENGILFSGEVYNMSINSDLLVLSSCESGVGQLLDGEGMLGLNRSFVYAGVPNVVFSLWKVFDHVTKDMMTQFYKYILDGHSYSAALRLVKLDMLQNEATASPEFWGAFLLIGR